MKAPTWVENNKVLEFQREIDRKKHQQKLGEISKQHKAELNAKLIEDDLKRRKEEKKKMQEFMTQEKNLEINRDNQVLLNKLVEISAGKWSQVKKDKTAGANNPGPKSLNLGFRKRETERIERENHAFAKRLFDKQAILSKKKLDEEFKSHLQYKKQIQKLKKKKADKKKLGGSEELQMESQQARSKSVDNTREQNDEEEAKEEENNNDNKQNDEKLEQNAVSNEEEHNNSTGVQQQQPEEQKNE